MNLKITGRDQLETLAGIVGVCSETQSLELVSTGQACCNSGMVLSSIWRGSVYLYRGAFWRLFFFLEIMTIFGQSARQVILRFQISQWDFSVTFCMLLMPRLRRLSQGLKGHQIRTETCGSERHTVTACPDAMKGLRKTGKRIHQVFPLSLMFGWWTTKRQPGWLPLTGVFSGHLEQSYLLLPLDVPPSQ